MTWDGALTLIVWAVLMAALLWWCFRAGRHVSRGGHAGDAARAHAELNAAMARSAAEVERQSLNSAVQEAERQWREARNETAEERASRDALLYGERWSDGDLALSVRAASIPASFNRIGVPSRCPCCGGVR